MPLLPAAFFMDAYFKWHWYLLDAQGTFLAESVDTYTSYEEAKCGYESACLSLVQATAA